ncbi:ABC transporter permease [Rossellomorea vietnamensis]|uniref:ABC transporter permease n=1 Tax=Rossellomorea vietnamensis TaxID=218284 RepID=UPI00054E6B1B|nr:ABC transporter permease [Rossellomorea vietnamensis]
MSHIRQVLVEQFQNTSLIFRLASYELKGMYLMHYLGVFWQFINPVVQIFIYWFVFGLGIRGGGSIHGISYFVWLITGLIPWFFINPSITQGANSIYSKLNLVSKMKFPMSILPTITIVSNFFSFSIMLLILMIILHFNGMKVDVYYIQIIYYLFCLITFLYATALFFSTFSTIVRDMQSLLQTSMKMLFFLTPILWDPSEFSKDILTLLKLNPLYYLVDGFRITLLYDRWFYEDLGFTLYFWSITLLMLFLGSRVHLKFRKRLTDYM